MGSPEIRERELQLSKEQDDQVRQILKRQGKPRREILYSTFGVPREWVETPSEFKKHTEKELEAIMLPNVKNVELRMKVLDDIMELNAKTLKEIEGVLTDSQYDRLQQLAIQRTAIHPERLFTQLGSDPMVARAIGMDAKEIQSVKREYRAYQEDRILSRVKAPIDQRTLSLKLLASLTDEQLRRLKTMGGKDLIS